MSCGHMICLNLMIKHTHEEERGINFVLGLRNLANLDDKLEPSQHLTH